LMRQTQRYEPKVWLQRKTISSDIVVPPKLVLFRCGRCRAPAKGSESQAAISGRPSRTGCALVRPTKSAKLSKSPRDRGPKVSEKQAQSPLTPKGEAVREHILAVALEAFARSGFKTATTREIAAAAGVNLPALRY